MKWIDMHCDTLSMLREGTDGTLEENRLCVDIRRLKQAGAAAQFFACFVNVGKGAEKEKWNRGYEKVLSMVSRARAAAGKDFSITFSAEELTRSEQKGSMAGILTVEEGGVLDQKMERLGELYNRGVRLMTLTWNYENCIGCPNSRDRNMMEKGLTPFGKEVAEQMNALGMIIDVSHLSDGGFYDCIRQSQVPVVASHSNARELCPHPRNLSDDMLRLLGEKGGVAGVNFYSSFLTDRRRRADLEDIVRHMVYMIGRAGEDAVALGTDFDGFDRPSLPVGMESVLDMEKLWDRMARAGLSPRQIEKIAYGNVMRVIRDVWK